MNLSKKVALNTIIQIFSKTVSIMLGLLAIAIMTRYLGKNGFGEYTTIITFLSFFAVAADLGLTLVTVQMISQPNVDQDEILSNLFSLRIFTALIMLLLAPVAVYLFPYSQEIKTGVMIAASSFLFIALNQIPVGLFQKTLRLDKVSIAEVVSRIFLVIGIWYSAKADLGLKGILWASVFSSFSSFFLHYIFALKQARIKLNFNYAIWLQIFKKSWPIGLTIVFNLIYLRADTLILSLFKSAEEVGIYGATYKVVDVLITIPFIFAGIVLPIMTTNWLNDPEKFKKVLQKSFDLMSILAMPLFFGTQFLAKPLMILVAGKEFEASGEVLKILILASSIIFIGTMFSHGVIALDKQKNIIYGYVFTAVTALIGYLLFIPRFSYFGAAWVTIYSELIIALASAFVVWKYSRFIPKFNIFFKSLFASILMSASLIFVDNLNIFISIITAVSVYFLSLYLVKGIEKQDLLNLLTKG